MYADLKLRSHLLRNPELANVIPLKPGVGQNIAIGESAYVCNVLVCDYCVVVSVTCLVGLLAMIMYT